MPECISATAARYIPDKYPDDLFWFCCLLVYIVLVMHLLCRLVYIICKRNLCIFLCNKHVMLHVIMITHPALLKCYGDHVECVLVWYEKVYEWYLLSEHINLNVYYRNMNVY